MTHPLPPRPNLEHLRSQAKSLLASWRDGDKDATQAFIKHLPSAKGLTIAAARRAPFKLADAQSVVARRSGFESWTQLTRHVALLKSMEGEWHFESLQVDGHQMQSAMLGHSKMLFDGDRFRMESPEGNYDGTFVIDATLTPMQLDIVFVEGPEAGNSAFAIFKLDGDALTICLGLVGSTRPTAFKTKAGSGHALEELRRASTRRPTGVTGGVAKPSAASAAEPAPVVDADAFAIATSPMLKRLQGKWAPVRLVTNGEEMRADWLPFGSRTAKGNEVKVVFGGQVMLHAKVRIDETVKPIAIDYLYLKGADKGKVGLGIMEWRGGEVCFLMTKPGQARPKNFSTPSATDTLSQWKKN